MELARKYWVLSLLMLFGFAAVKGQVPGLQTQIDGILPAGPYYPGQTVKIYGDEIYDIIAGNCDNLRFTYIPTSAQFTFLPDLPPSTVRDYRGFSSGAATPKDTIDWTFPANWSLGNYTVRTFDDEGCNGGNNSNNFAFTLVAPPTVLDYGDSIFCVGEPNPSPVLPLGPGTYSDLTFPSGLQNLVANSSTGQLGLHSGTVGMHVIQFTPTVGLASTFNVEVKAVQSTTLIYDNVSYCKDSTFIAAPTGTYTTFLAGGTLTPFPSMVGFNSANGSVNILPGTVAGNYNITFVADPNDCATSSSFQFQIINLDSAIFDYAPVYCHNSPFPGYPDTIISTPSAGGFFQGQGPGLVIDPVTGIIDLDSTQVGTHIIEYIPANAGCATIFSDMITVREPDSSAFLADTTCSASGSYFPTLITPIAGNFFSPNGAIVFADPATGEIDTDSSSIGGPFRILRGNGDAVCPDSTEGFVTILARTTAAFNYGSTAFCKNAPNPFPIFVSGSTGGKFYIRPNTALIDSVTGEIFLDSSNVGVYDVLYFFAGSCADTAKVIGLKIDTVPNVFFDILPDSICQNSGPLAINPQFNYPGDVWSLEYGNGAVLVGGMTGSTINTDSIATSGGPFRIVRRTTLLGCSDTFVDYVTVMPEEDPTFEYLSDPYCKADQNPVPYVAQGGGFFTGLDSTLVFANDTIGRINLTLSDSGYHYIQYTTGGYCPETAIDTIFIRDALNPYYLFNEGFNFCETDTRILSPVFDTTRFTASTFYFTIDSLPAALDTITGNLNLGLLGPGQYTVTMHLANPTGACTSTHDQLIEIFQANANPFDTLSFPFFNYCSTVDSVKSILTGVRSQEGRFFSFPPTLSWQSRDSGVVDIDHSNAGVYQIYFVLTNACSDTLQDSIQISDPTNTTLAYPNYTIGIDQYVEICKSDPNSPVPVLTPPAVGAYSYVRDPGNVEGDTLVFESDTTGVIDLSQSTPGKYTVSFTLSTGCLGSGDVKIRILPSPIMRIAATPNDTFCLGQTIAFTATGSQNYNIFQNNTLQTTRNPFITDSIDPGDTIWVTGTSNAGCVGRSFVAVKVYPVPNGIVLNPPGTISGADSIHILMTSTTPQTYFAWTAVAAGSVQLGSFLDSTVIFDPPANVSIDVESSLASDFEPGLATFYVTPKAYICVGEVDTVIVKINPSRTDIFIPEVFTPDGLGKNETWLIQWKDGIRPEDYEIFVYNRSGGLVHYMSPINDLWDGNGLPDGVYWYLLKAKSGSVLDKGGVTIRRK